MGERAVWGVSSEHASLGFWPSASSKHVHPPHCIPPSPPHTRRTVCHHHRPHEFHCWPQIVSDSVAKGARDHTTVISLSLVTLAHPLWPPPRMGVGGMWMPQTRLPLWAMIIRYHAYRATHPTTTYYHYPLSSPLAFTRFHVPTRRTPHTQRIHTLDSRLTALPHCRHQSRQTTAPQSHKTC
jgi:hypothetical protein